jgi:hypothetical protein
MWTINLNEEKKLLILKLSDTLTLNELSEYLKEIYDKNDGKFAAFNRFVDLSALKEIKIIDCLFNPNCFNNTNGIANLRRIQKP